MAKNPNQNQGIIVTISRNANVRLALPCTRLQRRILEFLKQAGVRSTEYHFKITGIGKVDQASTPCVGIKTKPDTTLEFGMTFRLPDGELFVCDMKAPVKCANDGLGTELKRAAEAINEVGWFEQKSDIRTNTSVEVTDVRRSENETLARKIDALISDMDIEIAGLTRDADRLIARLDEIKQKRAELDSARSALRKPKPE